MSLDDLKELRDYHLRAAVIGPASRTPAQRDLSLWHQRKAEALAELCEVLEVHLPALTRAFGS